MVDATVRQAADICHTLQAKGWNVVMLTRGVRSVDSYLLNLGLNLRHAPLGGICDPASAFLLSSIIRKAPSSEQIIIHTHHYRDAFTALLAKKISQSPRIRVISTRHKAQKAVDTRLYRRIYRNIDAHIFISDIAKRSFFFDARKVENSIIPSRRHILHNSVALTSLQRPLAEPSKGAVTALFRGALIPGQGLEELIEAMRILKEKKIRLRISGIGNPDYVDTLRARAINLGVMNRIDWKRKSPDLLSDMEMTHFGVTPSTKEWVGGYDNIPFMAVGRPQIATRCGTAAELLSDNMEALLIEPNNIQALADAMVRLGESAELRSIIGHRALSTFNSKLAWPKFIERLEHLYIP